VLRSTRRWWLVSSEGTRRLEVSAVRRQGAGLVAKWAGCDSPEAAEALKGAQVAVARCDFPRLGKGEYYWVDLIGLRVINRSERELGTVKGLRPSAAHDLLENCEIGIRWEASNCESSEWLAAHRINVAQCIGGGDLPERKRVIDQGSEEVDGLHERLVGANAVNARIV